MGSSKIDPIIQNKLQYLSTTLDKDALWSMIEPEIQPQKERKWAILFLLGSIALLSFTAWYLLVPAVSMQEEAIAVEVMQTNQPNGQIEEQAAALIGQEDDKATKVDDYITTKEELTILKKAQQPISSTADIDLSKSFEANSKQIHTESKRWISQVAIEKTGLQKTQQIGSRSNQQLVVSTSLRESKEAQFSQALTEQSLEMNKIGLLPLNPITSEAKGGALLQFEQPKPMKRVECYDYNYTYSPLSLQVYYGPGWSRRTLQNLGGGESETHYNQRKEFETVLEGHRAGVVAKFAMKNGLYLKAGLEVSNINERLEYETNSEEQITLEDQIIGYNVLPDGTEEPIYGSIDATIIRNKSWQQYNQYRFIEIPVIAGYQMRFNRWNFAAEAGVLWNQRFYFSDGETNAGGSTFSTVTAEPVMPVDYYKERSGYALHVSGGVGYHLNRKVTLWLTPAVRHGFGTLTIGNYPLKQNYTSANLLLGAEFKF